MELLLFAYFDTLRIGYPDPPENRYFIPLNFSRQVFILNVFSQFRYAAYRASSCYIWGKLGSRNRRPLPACMGKWPFETMINIGFYSILQLG